MVFILDGNSEHVGHACRGKNGEKNMNCDCSRFNQTPYTDEITEIPPYMRTYF